MAEPTTTNPSTGTGNSGTDGGSGGAGGGDFVPIGVWVCNWADIFPWLATGYSHSIDDTTEAEIMVKVRMMAQDFLTLNRLYRYAANLKLLIPEDPAFKDGDGKMCGQIADSFANAYGSLAAAKPVGARRLQERCSQSPRRLSREGGEEDLQEMGRDSLSAQRRTGFGLYEGGRSIAADSSSV